MATLEQLESALRNADEAGDEEAATAFASEILKMRSTESANKMATSIPQKVSGALKGIGKGIIDPFVGLSQLSAHADPLRFMKDPLYSKLEEKVGVPLTAESLDKSINQGELEYQKGREGFDTPRLVGNILSPLNLATSLVGGPSLLGNVVSGVSSGLFQPVPEGNFDEEKFKQLGVGAGAAGVAGLVGRGISRVVSPRVSPDLQLLRGLGVTPTLGQRLGPTASRAEQGLMSFPVLGDAIRGARNRSIADYNRGLGNRVLENIGQSLPDDVPAGHQMISHLERSLRDNYDSLLPNLTGNMDSQFRQEIANVQTMGLLLPQQQRDQLDRILQTQVFDKFTPQGMASGETLKEVEHQLGTLAHGYMRSQDFDHQSLGRALRESQRVLRSMIERNNPQVGGELQNANAAWADFLRVEKAATKAGGNEGVFSPSNFLQATKELDPTRRKSQFAQGRARLQEEAEAGHRVLGATVPDSGTAYRSLLGLGLIGGIGGASAVGYPGSALLTSMLAMAPYTARGQALTDMILSGGMGVREPVGQFINRASPLVAAGSAIGATMAPPLSYTP